MDVTHSRQLCAARFLHTRSHAAIAAQLKYQQPSLSSEFCGPFVRYLLDLSSKAVKALNLQAGVAAATATDWPASSAGLGAHLVYGLRMWGSAVVPDELYADPVRQVVTRKPCAPVSRHFPLPLCVCAVGSPRRKTTAQRCWILLLRRVLVARSETCCSPTSMTSLQHS